MFFRFSLPPSILFVLLVEADNVFNAVTVLAIRVSRVTFETLAPLVRVILHVSIVTIDVDQVAVTKAGLGELEG